MAGRFGRVKGFGVTAAVLILAFAAAATHVVLVREGAPSTVMTP